MLQSYNEIVLQKGLDKCALYNGMSNEYQYLLKFIVIGDTGTPEIRQESASLVSSHSSLNKQSTINTKSPSGFNLHHAPAPSPTKLSSSRSGTLPARKTSAQLPAPTTVAPLGPSSSMTSPSTLVPNRHKTFEHLQEWLKQLRTNGTSELEVLLIGNKTDLEEEREVTQQEGRQFAEQNGLLWMQLSAKDYGKVEGAFAKLANSIIGRIQKGEITETTPGIKICEDLRINPLRENKKFCC